MKRSNFWIFIPLWAIGFVGLAFQQSTCLFNFCMENEVLGWILMVLGFGGFFVSLYLINKWSGGK